MALGIWGSENVIVIQMRDPGGGNEESDRALGDLLVSDVRVAEVRGAEASGPAWPRAESRIGRERVGG